MFPYFRKLFMIYTDASNYQMGATITQDKQVITYWSKKLSNTQKKYPMIEQELLAICEVLKWYRYMLLVQYILIFIDHHNLTYNNTKF